MASAQGVVAGLSVARAMGARLSKKLRREYRRAVRKGRRAEKFQRVLWKTYSSPILGTKLARKETIICRCLSLSREEIESVLQPDIRSAGALKRLNRAGMGKCQGRYCAMFSIDLAAENSGEERDSHSWYAPAVPFKPTSIAAIASAGSLTQLPATESSIRESDS
jgi:hypothetical protein